MDQSRDENGFFKCNECSTKFFTKTVFENHIMKERQLKQQSMIKTEQISVNKENEFQLKESLKLKSSITRPLEKEHEKELTYSKMDVKRKRMQKI